MPNCKSTNSMDFLWTSGDLADIANHLWNDLLAQLQARKPNCKKGAKSWDLEVTKEDILKVRECSRKQFWRKAQHCHKDGKLPMVGNSGSMLFWIALNSLMGGDRPRVKLEDDQILGRPNSHGVNHVPSRAPHASPHQPCSSCKAYGPGPIILHAGRLLHTFATTYIASREVPAESLSGIVLCMPPP